jgi:signal transduction histidine kinase/DNA-binding response OmpR family regulator
MRRMTIRGRLIAALLIFTTVFTSFGIFTIAKIRELESVTTSIYDDPLKVSSSAIEARVDIIKMQGHIKDILLVADNKLIKEKELELVVLTNRIYENLDNIKEHSIHKESLELEIKTRENFMKWHQNHEQMLNELLYGDKDKAMEINLDTVRLINSMELNLNRIDKNAKSRAVELLQRASKVQKDLETILIVLNIGIVAFFTILFAFVIRSIVKSINKLQDTMNESTATGILKDVELEGNNEIAGIAKHYNALIQKLRNQFWLQDGQNMLNQEISSASGLEDVTQKSLGFLAEKLGVGKGALYLYNCDNHILELHSSYAYTEKEQKFGSYALGEGIIGQVGLDRKPIYMENIRDYEGYISTGVTLEASINIYTFPLLFEDKLHGVIELASFENFDELKCEFLREAGNIIAASVYAEIQNQRVKALLKISERTQMEARYNASQLLRTNQILEEQQQSMQQANVELEEQQQLLQQQSEELQQTNMQLEEQQMLMEEQTKLLNMRNQQLESSRLELMKHSSQLESANKYKTQFLANMSHELRTPLNSIILLSRLLMKNEKKELNKHELEKLEVIYGSGQELLRLINDVLDLSKIEAGKMNVSNEEFHTKDLLKELKHMFEGEAQEKEIKLKCRDYVNSKLHGDYNKIAQIARNLISNAIKFTKQGNVTIELKPHQNNDIKITIIDTGIGIASSNLNKIFEEFQQGDGSISRKYGGTGLGLSISKKLAEVMNGEILVESEEGKGSSFTLLIRNVNNLAESKSEKIELVDEYMGEAAATSDTKRNILIIEDDVAFAGYIKEINDNMGFASVIAATGREGLHIVSSRNIDAILLDLALPDMDGMEVLREIKSTQELRNIPVHIISAKDKINLPQKMGAVGYKQKPVEKEEIAEIIASMIDIKTKTPKRLLIVEDNEIQRNAMKELLEDVDIIVETADSEEMAKQMIDAYDYHAIVLDLELASGNGTNICKFMDNKKYETPVIVYTGKDLTIEQEKEIKKYADSIIIKTANSDDRLLDEVTLFLHKIKKNNPKPHYLISKTNKQHALTLKNKKILIVDDDTRNIFVLASALEDFGAEIVEAENGKLALELLEQHQIDLVLMDIMMPVMDGFQAIKEIRNNKTNSNVPIIAITAKSLKDDKDKCIAAGANDYISKPVDYDTLVRLVKAWISK